MESLLMKSSKVYQSKISLKNDCVIQFEPTKNANILRSFYSDLAGNLVRKLAVALNKFNNSAKQYYINIEKSCHNLSYAMQHWKLLKRF